MTTMTTAAQQLRDGTAAGTWTLDPGASTITTATKHFWGLITVRGTFTKATGAATVDADGAISARLEVDAASIDTKNTKRDEHLRSKDFFNAESHPSITFDTTDVTFTGDNPSRVTGTLNAGGVQQDVTFDATISADNSDRATMTADVVVDHRALGMTWSPMGMANPPPPSISPSPSPAGGSPQPMLVNPTSAPRLPAPTARSARIRRSRGVMTLRAASAPMPSVAVRSTTRPPDAL